MIRIGLTRTCLKSLSKYERYCTNKVEDNKTADIVKNLGFGNDKNTIESYSNIFTQKDNKVILHLPPLKGSAPEKRLEFVRMYLQANHLIGNKSVPLRELIMFANEKGFRGSKGKKTAAGNFLKSFSSKLNKKHFESFKGDDEKVHIRLTELGSKCALEKANIMNLFDPNPPSGRARDVLTVLKEKDWIDQAVKVKHLAKACAQFGFSMEVGNLRTTLRKGHYFFILESETDSLSLTPSGKMAIKQLE